MEKLLIIDGNSIINRAFYAIRTLTTQSGLNTNGIYGFLNIYFKVVEEEKPGFIAVAFDLAAPTFRHKMYSEYKGTRKGMPPELAEQMPVLREVLTAMGIPYIEMEGFEADDIIGSVSAECERSGVACRILTGDRDSLQLVSDMTNVLLTVSAGGKTQTVCYDPGEVKKKYGINPKELIEVKGLMGDSSDNIPGVAGIGEKTALSLVSKYKTIEGVYDNLSDIKGALLTKLEAGRESAFLSRELGTIKRDVPVGSIEDYRQKPFGANLVSLFENLEFKSMIKKLDLNGGTQEETAELEIDIKDADTDAAKKITASGTLTYILKNGEVFFELDGDVYRTNAQNLKSVFEDAGVKKIANNAKDDIVELSKMGIEYEGLAFDTAIAAYILNPARTDFSAEAIIGHYLGTQMNGASCAAKLGELAEVLRQKLAENGQERLYNELELPLIKVLASMQITGFKADKDMLEQFSQMLSGKIETIEQKIYSLAGEEFNINSPKQLGVILFEKLDLPNKKKTKSGYSTSVDVLEKLAGKNEIIPAILEYRHLAKLKSTYADGLQSVINPDTGRIHSHFNQTVTTTGRISSTDPNLQNIPVRTDLGRELRKVFVASDSEHILVDADYSQIELRVLASVADDERMKDAFKSGADIHAQTAAQVFGVADFMVTDDMRRKAKAVNFGIVYGISAFSLAEDIGVTNKEAKNYIDKYLDSFPSVRDYMKATVEYPKERGYVETLFNRRRYIPELKSSNFNVRAFGERVALNAPIQGTAADIIKLAMIKVYNALKKEAPRSRLILQVHDELIVEAHCDEEEKVKAILKREMESAFELSVPLTVDMASGRSWYDAK